METSRQEKTMRYLLSQLSEQEIAAFEAQCFDDDVLFDESVDLENDLLHSYIRGELSEAERQEFEAGYLISPARRRKLEFAQALEHRLFGNDGIAVVSERAPLTTSKPAGVDFASRSWRVRFALGAVALAGIATISWLAVINHRLNSEVSQLKAQQAEYRKVQQGIQSQLDALTARLRESAQALESVSGSHGQRQFPHVQPPGPEIMAFDLAPGWPRSAGTIKQLIVPPGALLIELKLYLENDRYSSYRALLETTAGKHMWRKAGLKSHMDSQGHRLVSFEVFAEILHHGDYLVNLAGVSQSGEIEDNIAAFRFSVAKR